MVVKGVGRWNGCRYVAGGGRWVRCGGGVGRYVGGRYVGGVVFFGGGR